MNEVEFDEAFDKFLDSPLCEREVGHISDLLRATFLAGWRGRSSAPARTARHEGAGGGPVCFPGPDTGGSANRGQRVEGRGRRKGIRPTIV